METEDLRLKNEKNKKYYIVYVEKLTQNVKTF
jgi:hypothetical protein